MITQVNPSQLATKIVFFESNVADIAWWENAINLLREETLRLEIAKIYPPLWHVAFTVFVSPNTRGNSIVMAHCPKELDWHSFNLESFAVSTWLSKQHTQDCRNLWYSKDHQDPNYLTSIRSLKTKKHRCAFFSTFLSFGQTASSQRSGVTCGTKIPSFLKEVEKKIWNQNSGSGLETVQRCC